MNTCNDCCFFSDMKDVPVAPEIVKVMLKEKGCDSEAGVCTLQPFHPDAGMWLLTPPTREACANLMIREPHTSFIG